MINASLRDANGETSGTPHGGSGRVVVRLEFRVGINQRDLAVWVHDLSSQHGWDSSPVLEIALSGLQEGRTVETEDTRRGDGGGE